MSDNTTNAPESTTSSSTSTTHTSKAALKPDDYTKGLDQEHVIRLTEDAYKHFAEYTKAELKSKTYTKCTS
jgi:hypothetical protein